MALGHYTSEITSHYRVFCVGGGIKKGGYGGVIFNDYKLHENDKISFISGQSGERLPIQDNLNNNYNLQGH